MIIRAYRIRGHLEADLDPLGPRGDAAAPRAALRDLRLHRGRPRPADLHRQRPRPRDRLAARDPRDREAHLLRHLRAAVHAHLRPRAVGLAQGAHRGLRQGDQLHPPGPPGDPQQAGRGRGLREVPAGQVHRHQALRPRRRRGADPGDGADHQARRRPRRRGDRHRHAAPRPPQRPRATSWASPTARSSTSSRAAASSPRRSRAPATSSTTSAPPPTASSTATTSTCR